MDANEVEHCGRAYQVGPGSSATKRLGMGSGSVNSVQPSDQWPSNESVEETEEEARGVLLFHTVVEAETVSSWIKLLRVAATVVRFISNCQRKRAGLPIMAFPATERLRRMVKAEYSAETKPLQREELQSAETIL